MLQLKEKSTTDFGKIPQYAAAGWESGFRANPTDATARLDWMVVSRVARADDTVRSHSVTT